MQRRTNIPTSCREEQEFNIPRVHDIWTMEKDKNDAALVAGVLGRTETFYEIKRLLQSSDPTNNGVTAVKPGMKRSRDFAVAISGPK